MKIRSNCNNKRNQNAYGSSQYTVNNFTQSPVKTHDHCLIML